MKIVKMSLVAAVAVAGLSTVSFAGTTVDAKADFRWKTNLADDKANKKSHWSRDRVDVNIHSASSDKNGKAHLRLRAQKGAVGINKAYVTYKVAGVTLGLGPRIGTPGFTSFSTMSGVTVSTKAGPATIKAGILAPKSDGTSKGSKYSKEIVSIDVKAGPAKIQADYQMGDAKEYLAALVTAKVGPAKLSVAYSKDNAEDSKKSLIGLEAQVSMAGATVTGGYTMAGDNGAKNITEKQALAVGLDVLGNFYGHDTAEAKNLYVRAAYKVAGITLGAYFTTTSDKAESEMMAYQVSAIKSLNKQTKLKVYYTQKDNKATDPDATVEVRLASKI